MTMPITHAQALLQHKTIMPQKGQVCSVACTLYTWCANFNDGEPCKEFQMLSNGKVARHIKGVLSETDRMSIETYVKDIQRYPNLSSKLLPSVLRFMKPKQFSRSLGFRGMLESAFRQKTPDLEPAVTLPRTGFLRMLEPFFNREPAAEHEQTTVIPEHLPKTHQRRVTEGFISMLEAAFPEPTTEVTQKNKRTASISRGFVGMIESAFSQQHIKRKVTPTSEETTRAPRRSGSKHTIIGYEIYEVDANGKLRVPEPAEPKPKIPPPVPECLIALAQTEKERRQKKTIYSETYFAMRNSLLKKSKT